MIFLDLVLIGFLLLVLYYLGNGAMYVPTHMVAVEAMTELVKPALGLKVVDLGSGDGRIVAAFARAGARATGIEVNPLFVWWSRYKLHRLGLSQKAKIVMHSFWRVDFSQFDVIVVFGITHIMPRLEAKILKQARPGTLIVSNVFTFKHLKFLRTQSTVSVYQI